MTVDNAITILRIYGPGSCASIAKAAKCNREELYRACYLAAGAGYVIHRPKRYELTEKGERRFTEIHTRPLLKDQPNDPRA